MTSTNRKEANPIKAQCLSVPIRLEVGVNKKKTYYLNLNGY